MKLTCLFLGIVEVHRLTKSESLSSVKPPVRVKRFPRSGEVAWCANSGGSGIRKGLKFAAKKL